MKSIVLSSVPDPVVEIGRRLDAHDRDALLVGGAVRDVLLGRESVDWDAVTNASLNEVRELARVTQGVRSTYDVGERFGTLGIALADGGCLEVSRYREPALASPTPAGRFAIDAGHRDFTVNAIGVELVSGAIVDPLDGQRDLEQRILRAPGDPHERLTEDPLRLLRAARFTAELGFDIEAETRAALPLAARALEHVAPERVRDELTKLLVGPFAPEGLEIVRRSGALEVILPELAALDGMAQPSFHDLDVLGHTIQAVGRAPATPVMRWAALLHDVGKGVTRSIEPDGRIRFLGHAHAGAALAGEIAARLRFSNSDTRAVVHLVESHMRLGDVNLDSPRSVDRAVRKLDLHVSGASEETLVSAEDAVELTLADFAATAHRDDASALREILEDAVGASRERGTRRAVTSPLSGRELMRALQLAEGPEVGIAKSAIEAAIEGGDLAPDDVDGALAVGRAALALGREP